MLQKLIKSLEYWKIWMMKVVLTIILMKNGKTLKQQSWKLNSSLYNKMKVKKHLKINGTMRNANLLQKKARENWLIKGRREKEEQEYHHKRKEAHKIIRNKKKTYMKNAKESLEEDQKHKNTRKMYQTVNQFKKGYQHKLPRIGTGGVRL